MIHKAQVMQILTTDAPQRVVLSRFVSFGFGIAIFASLYASTSCAQTFTHRPLKLDLPPQSLETALRTVSEASHTQIFYLKTDVQTCKSPALKGQYEVRLAYRQLIKNCPLQLIVSPSGVYVISRMEHRKARLNDVKTKPAHRPEHHKDETIIITARPGAWLKTRLESGYAVSKIDAMTLNQLNGASVAESLKAIPGLWVEASGGEASNNIRARGIPRDGYASLAVYEDGLPVQHDAGLGYLNVDQSIRIDETIQSVEVVRGGPASIFASNAPGGLINIISRRASVMPEAMLKLTGGDNELARIDLFAGASLGKWKLSFGGFYRQDQGQRNTGFKANYGGQYRLSATRQFANSELDLDYRHLDDNVAFYLPVPVRQNASGNIEDLAQFDATRDTLAGPDLAKATIINSLGRLYPFDLRRGTDTVLDQITIKYRLNLSDHNTLILSHRARRSATWRNAVFPGSPRLQADKALSFMAATKALYPTTNSISFVYADTGTPFLASSAQEGLVLEATLSSVRVPLKETITDLRLIGEKPLWGKDNSYSLGLYSADVTMAMQRLTATALIEAKPQARRLNIVALDSFGYNLGVVSRDGIIRDGAQFDNFYAQQSVTALYASDEIKLTSRLNIDVGIRLEVVSLTALIERRIATDGHNFNIFSDDSILGGTGHFDSVQKNISGQSFTAGVVYDPSPANGVGKSRYYTRLTKTERLPGLSDLSSYPGDNFHREHIWLWEAGYKRSNATYDFHAVAFATLFSGYRFNDTVYDPLSRGYVQKVAYTDTQTLGLEMEGIWKPSASFEMGLSATLQQPRFASFQFTELVDSVPVVRDYGQNQLLRVPRIMVRWMPTLYGFNRKGRLGLNVEYYSDRYGDAANKAKLPAYMTIGLNARYRCSDSSEVLLTVDNLTDTIGLTEGNPRAGQFISADSDALYFSARPIFGRTLRISFKKTF